MKLCLPAILLIFISCSAFSQSGKPTVAKEPDWITKNSIDYNQTSLDKDATDGYIDISYETQVSLADQSKYFRSSKKIISPAGAQNGSEISVSYDPSYEQLIFHSIMIIRKGEPLNKLKLSDIKTVHQEKDLSDFIYNGTVNAILILGDVRQGDIIEYSYSIKGFNPIYKNKYSGEYSMEYAVPMYNIYYKLLVPQGRKINIKNVNGSPEPAISAVNGQQVYEWHKAGIKPLLLQDYTPSWYDPYAYVLVSEYNSWKEVNDWAMELFPVKKELAAPLQKKIREIESANPGDDERTRDALRFVQDDIRYMGIEMGENSHRPADPSKVFAQRFGDCKEKSYLLCCMLRAMNIDASPVLINTVSKKNINNFLPSPGDFDHATVRVKLDGAYYWFDPTIAYQRGHIKNIFFPDYQAGLVIAENTSSLTPIIFRNISSQYIKEFFKIPDMSGAARLTVTTSFYGAEADAVRSDFNNESIPELMTTYQKFYGTYYDDIKADSLTYTDNDSTGLFTTKEYYSISNLWNVDKDKANSFSFSAFVINNIFKRPKEKKRKMPFRIAFPAKYKEEVTVDLPENWKVTETETHLKNACYTYNGRFYCANNQVYLTADYENFKDFVTIEESASYFKDLTEYDDVASFELSSGKKEPENNGRSTDSGKNILSIIVVIGAFIGVSAWWSRRR